MRIVELKASSIAALMALALVFPIFGCSSGADDSYPDAGADLVGLDGTDDSLEEEFALDGTDGMESVSAGEDLEEVSPDEEGLDWLSDMESPPDEVMDSKEVDLEPIVCTATNSDAQGPYYIPGAPFKNPIVDSDEPGPRLVLSGSIGDTACVGIGEAVVDVWQTDAAGLYPTPEEGFRLRGKVAADGEGSYSFETVLPGLYEGRPSHVHVKVSGTGFETLTTQIYFAGDPFLWPEDSCGPPTCYSNDPERIIALQEEVIDGVAKEVGVLNFTLSPVN